MRSKESPFWTRPDKAVVATIALLGLALHMWFAVGADALDSDRALVLLMARHFAQGEFALFSWQQNYMGALEPLLLTPLALLGWATPTAAALVGIAVTASLAALSVALARRLGAPPWMALLLWAVPPAVVAHHHVALYGARLVATLLAAGAFTLSLRTRSAGTGIALGALTGLAYFGDHLMLPWAAATMYVMARRGHLLPFAVGALPLVTLDTVAAMMTPAFHLAGPNDPAGWLGNLPLLLGNTVPQLFGILLGRAPGPLFEPATALVPAGWTWLLFTVPGTVVLCALFLSLVRGRSTWFGTHPIDSGIAAQGLLLTCLVGLGVFVLVGGGGDRWPVRYLVPLWPAISVLAALAVARWRPAMRPAAALVALPAVFTLYADRSWPRGPDGDRPREEALVVGSAVEDSGARAVWADYWDVYRMALLIGESPPWVTLRIIERRPDWVTEARSASPVAYLLRSGDVEVRGRLRDAEEAGTIRIISEQDVGRYQLLVTDRSAPGLVLMNSPPSRAWQRLAALAGGLLFLGTLVALGLFTIRSRTSPGLENSSARRS